LRRIDDIRMVWSRRVAPRGSPVRERPRGRATTPSAAAEERQCDCGRRDKSPAGLGQLWNAMRACYANPRGKDAFFAACSRLRPRRSCRGLRAFARPPDDGAASGSSTSRSRITDTAIRDGPRKRAISRPTTPRFILVNVGKESRTRSRFRCERRRGARPSRPGFTKPPTARTSRRSCCSILRLPGGRGRVTSAVSSAADRPEGRHCAAPSRFS